MGMYDLPDPEYIRNLQNTGYRDGKDPCPPHCPVCGEECDTVYRDKAGDVIGCDFCVTQTDAWAEPSCFN